MTSLRFRLPPPLRLAAALLTCLGGCTGSAPTLDQRCDEVVGQLAQCYPDLAAQGQCTAQTLELYEAYDVASLPCATMDDMGKADVFSYGGCGAGEHVCAYIFCCDDYVITQGPESWEWDITGVVEAFQAAVPAAVARERDAATTADLLGGVSWTWEQEVVEPAGAAPKAMAVELSERVIEVPYAAFSQALAAEDWGVSLAFYLGGEVRVNERDAQGRAVRQHERMVLNPFPCDMDTRLANNDMTKVEVIEYGSDWARVNWRVYYSDNDSTEADVGSVEFSAHDARSTRVTFHSAHRLNAPLGIHIPNDVVRAVLKGYFLDHIRRYAQLVGG
jgi:hypothetical protein